MFCQGALISAGPSTALLPALSSQRPSSLAQLAQASSLLILRAAPAPSKHIIIGMKKKKNYSYLAPDKMVTQAFSFSIGNASSHAFGVLTSTQPES